jgi:hypothetical protein
MIKLGDRVQPLRWRSIPLYTTALGARLTNAELIEDLRAFHGIDITEEVKTMDHDMFFGDEIMVVTTLNNGNVCQVTNMRTTGWCDTSMLQVIK